MQYLDSCTLNPFHIVLVETPTHLLQMGEGDPQPSYPQMTATSQGRLGIVFGLLSATSLGLCLELLVKFLYSGGISGYEAGHQTAELSPQGVSLFWVEW